MSVLLFEDEPLISPQRPPTNVARHRDGWAVWLSLSLVVAPLQVAYLAFFLLILSAAIAPLNAQVPDLAETQQWEKLAEEIEAGNDVDTAQRDGMTALHWAAYLDNLDAVKQLTEAEADVHAVTDYAVTPLSIACELGHDSIAKALLEAGANITEVRLGRETPLMLAARNGNLKIVRMLISAGADLDAKEAGGQTALMWAAAAGNTDAVDALIEGGADINIALPKSGFTAFTFAARQGKLKVVERMLKAGIDVNTVMKTETTGGRNPRKNMSALLLAIESGHLELALRLVELGADPNDQRSGYGPLHAITWVRKTKRGDDPSGDPAPRITGSLNSIEFVRRMVEAGADVDLKLKNGKPPGPAKLAQKGLTPFIMASRTADVPLMKLLLELGADPEATNEDQCNAMMTCAGVGVIAVGEEPGTEEEVDTAIRMLAKLGLDLNAVDANGETAMHGAAYRNFPSTVKLLSELGADPQVWNSKNKHGWTPRMIAAGERPGSLKPSPETIATLDEALTK